MTTIRQFIRFGLFCFIVGTTIGFASVNATTLSVIPYLRLVALAFAALVLLVYVSDLKVNYHILPSVVIFAFMISYGLLRGLDNLAHVNYLPSLATSTIVVLTGLVYFAIAKAERIQLVSARYFVAFSFFWLLLLVLTGGLEVSNTLGFNFQIYSQEGRVILYSQGVSKFFGIAAIAAMWVASRANKDKRKIILYGSVLVFVFLSFLGGGRGDFLALMIVIFLMIFSKSWRGALFAVLVALMFVLIFFEYVPRLSDDFVAARRFAVLLAEANFGMRDVLFSESLSIILNEPKCFFFGCGFTYFQEHYGYSYGLYPHNIFLEALIVWGAPLVFVVVILFTLGFFTLGRWDFLSWLGFFLILIGMKSGDVLSSWFALSFLFYYAGVGISEIIGKPRARNARE